MLETSYLKKVQTLLAALFLMASSGIVTAAEKPNILIIWGDDIGTTNISRYGMGIVGYETPNIDRIATEGIVFTDYYAEQSCTAGRAAFVTGQHPIRTGLTKVGFAGSKIGLQPEDPTLAELLKPLGYATGQFGKNHLGDLDEFLPSNHGFDEFFGNLYHLNAEEEPEDRDYPKDPKFHQKFGPRGVIHSYGDGKIKDTGPLTSKRMETIDDEVLEASLKFIKRANQDKKPFFVWFNATRMHWITHVSEKNRGISGQHEYGDGMVEHDRHVGKLLDLLDELGIAENTIVMYSTDNGAPFHHWPDSAVSPYRSEKNTNWEGAFRVPAMVRWPGKIDEGKISRTIMSHLDWVPTLMAAVGEPDIKQKLKDGYPTPFGNFRVHLDGYNFLPYLTGEVERGPRQEFFYFSDGGDLIALRLDDWKLVFAEQRARKFDLWREPFVELRMPKLFHLRRDPFERADTDSNAYNEWLSKKMPPRAKMGLAATAQFLGTFREYPPRQKPETFTVDRMMEKFTGQK